MRQGIRSSALLTAVLFVGVGCGSGGSDEATGPAGPSTPAATAAAVERMLVAAAFYPIAEAVQRVGGARVQAMNLTPPGGHPHDLELTPPQVAQVEGARAVFYLGRGFQPAVAKLVAGLPQASAVDILERAEILPVEDYLKGTEDDHEAEAGDEHTNEHADEHGHSAGLEGGGDPHVWVDPVGQRGIAQQVRDTLVAIDPDGAGEYDRNLAAYAAELDVLDAGFRAGLATCRSRVIVTSHRAFSYLAKRYDLRQIPIAGLSPQDEPDPRTLRAVADAAERENVTTVFFEEQVPRNLAETIAREIGASTAALDPVETVTGKDLSAGRDYLAIMRDNLGSLRSGLGCT